MVKKRLIFTYLISENDFVLSRNFRLQRVGNIEWVKKHYRPQDVFSAIDELIILNVTRRPELVNNLCEVIRELSKQCFVPIAAGGGIHSVADARRILEAGADKVVINTAIFENEPLVEDLVRTYGSSCVIGSIDYAKSSDGFYTVLLPSGVAVSQYSLRDAVLLANKLNLGELYLTSIDKDGTGMGFDYESLKQASEIALMPVIGSGGAGNFEHISRCYKETGVNAVSTANLYNFLGKGLMETRINLIQDGCDLANWNAPQNMMS